MSGDLAPTIPAGPPPEPGTATAHGGAGQKAAAPALAPSGYHLEEEVGSGGMGVVYRARDSRLGRDVAIKVLRDDCPSASAAARRFLEEARITAQLQHPGIPPVFEVGELPDGRPFLAMKLIKGHTLDEELRARPDPAANLGRFVAIFEQVCQAVAYAHSHSVIHRDLKPANVMVGAFAEVQVMDWGLAKVLTDAPAAGPADLPDPHDVTQIRSARALDSATEAGSLMGTPAYMPPEQAAGATTFVDARSDVFGLGAILCSILTGEPPYAGQGDAVRIAALQARLGEAYDRLTECGAEPALIALARACLAADPADRPAGADAVAKAVAAHRAEAEARARRAEVDRIKAELAATAERRRRRTHLAMAAAVMAVVGLAVGVGWWYQSVRAAAMAERTARRAATELTVAAALDDARVRSAEAWAATDRPDRMRASADLVLAAVDRAEGAAATGDPSTHTQAAVHAARQAAGDLDRHARLLAAGEQALQEYAVLVNGKWDRPRLRQRLADAFREFGWDVANEPPARLADRVAASRVRDKVLGLLCDWSFQANVREGGDPAERDRTADVIRLVRQQAGGLLAQWQDVRDREDRDGLIRLAADPDAAAMSPELILELARNLGTIGAVREQVALLRRAADRYPTHVWIRENLAEDCLALNPPLVAEALWHAGAAAAIRPDSAICLEQVGTAMRLSGDSARAGDVFERLTRLTPDDARAHNMLGVCRLSSGDRPRAVAAFEMAVRLAPGIAVYYGNLTDGYFQTGRPDDALAAARAAIARGAMYPRFAAVLALLSQDLVRAGRAADAEPLLRHALAVRQLIAPNDWTTANARSMLGEALAAQRKYATAGPLLKRGYEELKTRAENIPASVRGDRLREAAARLVRLSEATGDAAEAARWRAELAKYPPPVEAGPPPRTIK